MENRIGDIIRYYRRKKGLTLEQLSKEANISRQTLSRYETGIISNIPSDRIEKLAEALKVSPAAIMGWEDDAPFSEQEEYYNDPEVARIAEEIHKDPTRRILFDATKDMSKSDIDFIVNLIDGLKKREQGE